TVTSCTTPPSFFSNTPPPPALSPLSLHDALPISPAANPLRRSAISPYAVSSTTGARRLPDSSRKRRVSSIPSIPGMPMSETRRRSEEHTSELQSLRHLVCRLLLEKKKNKRKKASN